MNERCENCKYFHRLKTYKSTESSIEFEERSCCTMLLMTEEGSVIETFPNDVCEVFIRDRRNVT